MGLKKGKIRTKSPSNIALIKYWGKCGEQIPANASLSFTLSNSLTETELSFTEKPADGFGFKFFFHGQHKPDFEPRIAVFLQRIAAQIPFLKDYYFEIHSYNTFPHSSGMASSASGMSALALALVQLERDLGGDLDAFAAARKASFLARLGSGSACRSIYKGLVVWGHTSVIPGSSDEYAIPYPHEVHPVFRGFQDTILLIHRGQKSVSSTIGHRSMQGHPYAKPRFKQAEKNLESLIPALKSGDLEAFGRLVEHEALSLHAMMMTAAPAYLLMLPNTVAVLQAVWDYRKQTRHPLYFTLDAGANVHLLYPKTHRQSILDFIDEELLRYCQEGHYITDRAAY